MAQPTRPDEIPGALTLIDLAEQRHRHAAALLEHRHGLAVLDGPEVAGHALAVLAYSTELSKRALYGRWVYATEALAAGASPDQVAAATDLTVDEFRTGLRSWADGQHRYGYLDPARHAEVLRLLGEPPPPPEAEPGGYLPGWQLRRMTLLLDALGDPPLTVAQRACLLIVARQEHSTVEHLATVIRQARGAGR
ncbi:MAG TPA: hypothetical protein VHH34_14400 [Pseudonocardiaceae bacterium]|nr:hypothetical protein [Pseudonocardiaceae bacterium]